LLREKAYVTVLHWASPTVLPRAWQKAWHSESQTALRSAWHSAWLMEWPKVSQRE
jgi:hypothetical protein